MPATAGCETPSIIGPGSPLCMIRPASGAMPSCAAAATAMLERCVALAIGCSMSCARCCSTRRCSTPITKARRWPSQPKSSLGSTAGHPFVPTCRAAKRRAQTLSRMPLLRHRRSRREASWTARARRYNRSSSDLLASPAGLPPRKSLTVGGKSFSRLREVRHHFPSPACGRRCPKGG